MLNTYIFCSAENIFHPPLFDAILKKHRDGILGGALFPGGHGSASIFDTFMKCVRFDGPLAPVRLIGRLSGLFLKKYQKKITYLTPVEKIFKGHGLSLDSFNGPNDPACILRVKQLEVDVIFNYQPMILKKGILQAPKLACLNQHTSALPNYPRSPTNKSIIDYCCHRY